MDSVTKINRDSPHDVILDEHGVLEGECLIYVGPEPWEGLWRNRHQLMSRFAKKNIVFYVEPRLSIKKLFRGVTEGTISFKDIFHKSFSVTKDGVHVYHSPKWLPVTEKPLLKQITDFGWKWMLRHKAREMGAGRPIVWLSRPEMVRLKGKLGEKLLVYHVVDEYLGYYGLSEKGKRELVGMERQLLHSADVVIVVSPNLMKSKSPFNKNTFLVPNAVDFEAFANAKRDVLHDVPRPIVGYSGLIGNRLDIELLISMADERPEWSFVFVGEVVEARCVQQMSELKKKKNTYFIGRKNIEEVPSYVGSFDVGIIPYKVDLQSENGSPLKIYEYMAAGIPVVTSNFNVALEFDDVVHVCSGVKKMGVAIQECIEKSPDVTARVYKGVIKASENTWNHRISYISKILRYNDAVG
ncbi:MAG TPA: glycosyltransferase family 1 protein [Chromatiales bacterium]|nr:glycosyltransferase family 1 protein [Chromatiales bacterium]